MFEGPVLGVVIVLLFVLESLIVFYYQRENHKLEKATDGLMLMIAYQQEVIEKLKREKDFKEKNNIEAD